MGTKTSYLELHEIISSSLTFCICDKPPLSAHIAIGSIEIDQLQGSCSQLMCKSKHSFRFPQGRTAKRSAFSAMSKSCQPFVMHATRFGTQIDHVWPEKAGWKQANKQWFLSEASCWWTLASNRKQLASNGLHQGSTDLSAEQECLGGGNVINQRLMQHGGEWKENSWLWCHQSAWMTRRSKSRRGPPHEHWERPRWVLQSWSIEQLGVVLTGCARPAD